MHSRHETVATVMPNHNFILSADAVTRMARIAIARRIGGKPAGFVIFDIIHE